MTIAQRLVRAGLVFIVFGTVASLIPTNGTAMADTTYNGVNSHTLGTKSFDKSTGSSVKAGSSIILTAYSGNQTTQTIDNTATFTPTIAAGFTITPGTGASLGTVTVTVGSGTAVGTPVTVTAHFGTKTATYMVTAI